MTMQDTNEYIHTIRSDEVVVDHRRGGRIKWVRDPLALEKTDNREVRIISLIMRPLSIYFHTDNRCPGCARR